MSLRLVISPRLVRLLGGSLMSGLLAIALFTMLGTDAAFAATTIKPGFSGFLEHYMAPIMFASLVLLLLLGYPVAFALAACGLLFAVIGIELGLFVPNFLQALPERVYGTMNNDVLLAIPFFTFMGLVLERSGMAEDLLDTIGQLFGPIRGGLAYAVIFVGALLAATTGVVAASVISMGLISLPIMLRYGYDRRVASGVIAASGTLAQIIPPSLVLIVMADQLGKSVGDMYEGAFIPGIVLACLYAGYVFLVSMLRPTYVPALPVEARTLGGGITSLIVMLLLAVFLAFGIMFFVHKLMLLVVFLISAIMYPVTILATLSLPDQFWVGTDAANAVYAALFAAFTDFFTAFLPTGAVRFVLRGLSGVLEGVVQRGSEAILAAFAVMIIAYCVAQANKLFKLRLLSRLAQEVIMVLMPPLGLIFLVLGTIFIGLATPTEGGAMGATGAMIIAIAKRRLTLNLVSQALDSTAKLSAFVVFILVGARVFSLTFYGVDGHKWVEELLIALPGGQTGFLIVTNVMVFLLAFFLDFFELAFIVVPLLGPPAEKLGIDLIWFGVILGVNMQTSFMHPPFGFALFYLRSVAPKNPYFDKVTGKEMEPVTTGQIYWGAVPFVIIQCIMVALVILFPKMVMVYKGTQTQIDPKAVEQQLKNLSIPELDTPIGLPGLTPPGGSGLPGFNPPKP